MVLLAAVSGCSRPGPEHTYLVAVEAPFWRAVTVAYPSLERDLHGTVLADGRRLQVFLAGAEQPLAELEEQLAGARYAGVVLTPLLSFEAEALAAAHPGVRFVLLTWTGATGQSRPPPANVTEVAFERTGAHQRAGRLVAAYLADHPATQVAIVAATGSGEAARAAAFRSGLGAGGAHERVIEQPFDAPRDSASLRSSLEAARGAGAGVVYLEVGALTGEALRTLAAAGLLAVVGNWGNRPGFEATVLLSVDDPPLAALVAGIEAPASTRTAVAAQVVWGLAAPVPNTAAGLYDGVRAAPADAGSTGRSPTSDDP